MLYQRIRLEALALGADPRDVGSRLPDELRALLTNIVLKHRPGIADRLSDVAVKEVLKSGERGDLGDILTAEFAATGVGDDGEPNRRGLMIEELIDWVGFD